MSETARKLLTDQEFPGCIGKENPMRNNPAPGDTSALPRIHLSETLRGWAALVLAVQEHSMASMTTLLRRGGRGTSALAEARRLLIWAFLEVSDLDDDASIAWIEQCITLSRRSIVDSLRGPAPDKLPEVIQTYRRLAVSLGPADVACTIAAGLLGQHKPRSRVWPKGFLERLGLRNT